MYTPNWFLKVIPRNFAHHQKTIPCFGSQVSAMTTLKFVETIEYFAAFIDKYVTCREPQIRLDHIRYTPLAIDNIRYEPMISLGICQFNQHGVAGRAAWI